MRTITNMKQAIDFVKENSDIVKIISQETDLRKSTGDLYKGLCCFHDEKTPSLTVTPSKGLYHCFGCKESGDAVSFYKKKYNYSTIEAIEQIAEDYKIDIEPFKRELTPEEIYVEELKTANQKIAKALNNDLISGDTPEPLDYLMNERGITMEAIKKFDLGYCSSYSRLVEIAKGIGISREVLEDLMLTSDYNHHWDNVIVYPIYSMHNQVHGFKNRPLDKKDGMKFLGTSQDSVLHQKGQLYGINVAREGIRKNKGQVIVVEGQHDVIMPWIKGVTNVVSSEGTAFNEERLKSLIEIGVREIVIVYDGDNAGKESSARIAKSILESQVSIPLKIADMPNGADPDSLCRSGFTHVLLQKINESVYASQFMVDHIALETGTKLATQKIDFIKKAQVILKMTTGAERLLLTTYIADIIGVLPSSIDDVIREEESRGKPSILFNVDGERIILGGLIRDEMFRLDYLTQIQDSDWYLPKHAHLYELIKDMAEHNIPISTDTIKAKANNENLNLMFSGGQYIDEMVATIGEYRQLVEDFLDKAMRRKIVKEAQDLASRASNPKNRIVMTIEEHNDKVQAVVTSGSTDTSLSPTSGAKQYMDSLLNKMRNPNKIGGIELGHKFKSTTKIINGLENSKLIIISANQSVGKTTLLANILNEISVSQKQKWAHFTLEMPSEENVEKIIQLRAGVRGMDARVGNVTDDEFAKLKQATLDYHESGLIVIDDCYTLEAIVNKTRQLIRKENIVGISIDYLQLMSIEKQTRLQQYQIEGEISGSLKRDVAKGLGIPVIALSQMSRRAVDREVQKAEDGQGAYKIAQDSDIYMILQEKSQQQIDEYGIEQGNMLLNIDKNRGGTADVLIDLFFDRATQNMYEVQN